MGRNSAWVPHLPGGCASAADSSPSTTEWLETWASAGHERVGDGTTVIGLLGRIVLNVDQRFRRWLGPHGLLKAETGDDFSNEAAELSALDACAQASLGLGNLVTVRNKPKNGRACPASWPRRARG